MNNIITANELKTKGVALISEVTKDGAEAIISVRGKNRFVIIPIESYNKFRELELEAAIEETRKEIKDGKFVEESVAEHIARITNA
jgi:prevent-host-death family protein